MTLPVKTLPYAGICASQSDCPTHVLQPQSHACHMMQSKMASNAKRRRVVDVDKGIHESIRRLGYENVKDHQRKVIESFVEGNDVFAVLPTGYGKSLCYFCLPYLCDYLDQRDPAKPWSVVIVVSPLMALMNDQVRSLTDKGVSAVVAKSGTEMEEDIKTSIVAGKFQIIFTTPELLVTNKEWIDVFRSPSLNQRLVCLVIDEAHCVKKWLVMIIMTSNG